MPRAKMAATLSIEDDIRLGSWRLAIAGEARPGARHDGAGVWRFGSRGALWIHVVGQSRFSDNGPDCHGSRPLRLIQHSSRRRSCRMGARVACAPSRLWRLHCARR
jgi:hypothetical protein